MLSDYNFFLHTFSLISGNRTQRLLKCSFFLATGPRPVAANPTRDPRLLSTSFYAFSWQLKANVLDTEHPRKEGKHPRVGVFGITAPCQGHGARLTPPRSCQTNEIEIDRGALYYSIISQNIPGCSIIDGGHLIFLKGF